LSNKVFYVWWEGKPLSPHVLGEIYSGSGEVCRLGLADFYMDSGTQPAKKDFHYGVKITR
jgi:hypothetical protein